MSFRFDHAIIAVEDLETAITDYEELGFTVLEGGVHADGSTHNALICFADGSYIELLASTGESPGKSGATGFLGLLETGEGLAGYALASDDIEADVKALKSRGIKIGKIQTGGRTRDDGIELQWKTAMIEGTRSPFIIQDITPREDRVPGDVGSTTHPNMVNAIVEVGFVADDVAVMVDFYRMLLEGDGKHFEGETAFAVGETTLAIAPAKSRDQRTHAAQRLDMPFDLMLRTSSFRWARQVTWTEAHGARFRVLAFVHN